MMINDSMIENIMLYLELICKFNCDAMPNSVGSLEMFGSAFAFTNFIYRKILRLHDILYFLWIGRWTVLLALAKLLGFLLVVGVVLAGCTELWEAFVHDFWPQGELPKKAPLKKHEGKVPDNWSRPPKWDAAPNTKKKKEL
jgi:hypothetical protein